MEINHAVNCLLDHGLAHHLIEEEDTVYASNRLADVLGLDTFEREITNSENFYTALEACVDHGVRMGLCEDDMTSRDLFDTRIMDCLMPRPSEMVCTFRSLYSLFPRAATDWFYDVSMASNYIRKSRTNKNIRFVRPNRYGRIEISINLSKPEKDPKEIAKARLVKSSGYPKCLLCRENEGFAGNRNHPARTSHRILPLDLTSGRYFLQYSPYEYYNEHCILLNEAHVPMKVDRQTFENLFAFVTAFPHYMAGSNTDIPIVGGSILSHDHYQGGRNRFPMDDARAVREYDLDGVRAQMLYWPLSAIRLSGTDPAILIDRSVQILDAWKEWEDIGRNILPWSGDVRHNAITPIVRWRNGQYEIDLVLRNNRTSQQFPDGIFHPHPEHHHVKKENIGLIEVMGLAILPGRLKEETEQIRQVLAGEKDTADFGALEKHAQWIEQLKAQLPVRDLDVFLEDALVDKFTKVLEDAGVFKMDANGIEGFDAFITSLGARQTADHSSSLLKE